ncbi:MULTISPECIES: hypothetical protein [unclassified Mesorhizobium]|uniref:hypothetical protein n=1 Tax=unclassified Mesorhizobium TaxID=325217 RepID=UPI00112E6A86|nr:MULTISPECIES: hypothetical protein [unclassified Mesorhizobium]TPN57389.1 hypothetical protein FJ978_01980 [Mesorhizobium sp. B1-1-7]TPN57664.1 hypothetical protein FJ976_03230 [Mesorhizobium sp. B1-1-9]
MQIEEIKSRLEKAVTLFMDDQKQLLELDVNERALGATLAHLFVRELFPDHKVDAEYNRVSLDGSPKRLNLPLKCGGENTPVYSDIVVHHRGDSEENILVVEIKKPTESNSGICSGALRSSACPVPPASSQHPNLLGTAANTCLHSFGRPWAFERITARRGKTTSGGSSRSTVGWHGSQHHRTVRSNIAWNALVAQSLKGNGVGEVLKD